MDELLPAEPIDWTQVLSQMRGNPRIVRALVEAMLAESPRMIAAIRAAIDASDTAALKLAAHTFKGTLRYFGDTAAFDWAYSLEKMGSTGDLGEAADGLDRLESAYEPLARSLRAYLAQ